MEFADTRLDLIMEVNDIDKQIVELEKIRGVLPYHSVLELKKLKKRKLYIKDILAGHI